MKTVTLDFETYYAVKYSLSSLSYTDYIYDPRFKVELVGIKQGNLPTQVYPNLVELWKLSQTEEKILFIMHKASFDLMIMKKLNLLPRNYKVFCTEAAGRLLVPKISHSLNNLSIMFGLGQKTKALKLMKDKHFSDLTAQKQKAMVEYTVQDVELTYSLHQALKDHVPEKEKALMDHSFKIWVSSKLRVDTEKAKRLIKEDEEQRKKIIVASGVDEKTLSSNNKYTELLKKLEVEVPYKTSPRTGKKAPALGQADHEYQVMMTNYPQYTKIYAARKAAKSTITQTRLQRLIQVGEQTGGELPVLLHYAGAEQTKRYSGGNKLNLQNLSARNGGAIREVITAPPGYKLVIVDSAQIEARTLAWMADENEILDAFRHGRDVYSEFASKVYKCEVTKSNPKTKTLRFVGKTCILGLGYGTGSEKLRITLATGSPTVVKSPDEAKAIVNLYRQTYRNITNLWRRMENALLDMSLGRSGVCKFGEWSKEGFLMPNHVFIKWPCLRREDYGWVYGIDTEEGIYGAKVVQQITQALARTIVAYQMLRIHKHYPINLMVHDELVAVVPEEQADECLAYMLYIMRKPLNWCKSLPLDAEGVISDHYQK